MVAADRATAIGAAEAAISESDVDELARRLCVLLRDAWLRRQRELATTQINGSRAADTHATRPPCAERQDIGETSTDPSIIAQRQRR